MRRMATAEQVRILVKLGWLEEDARGLPFGAADAKIRELENGPLSGCKPTRHSTKEHKINDPGTAEGHLIDRKSRTLSPSPNNSTVIIGRPKRCPLCHEKVPDRPIHLEQVHNVKIIRSEGRLAFRHKNIKWISCIFCERLLPQSKIANHKRKLHSVKSTLTRQ